MADPFDTFVDEHWRCGELVRALDYDGSVWTISLACSCGAEFVRSGDQCPLSPGWLTARPDSGPTRDP